MEISNVDPADRETVAALVELRNLVAASETPWVHEETVDDLAGELAYGHDGEPPLCRVGRLEGKVVAEGDLRVSSWDNRDLAWLHVLVHPDLRRRGLGTLMLRHLEEEAAQLGRTKLGLDAWDETAGVAFAKAHGYSKRSQAVNRRQHLAEVPLQEVRELRDRAAAAAADYELVRIVGKTPEELLGPLAVASASINDAPLDDLEFEDENYDPERVRLYEEMTLKRERTLYRLLARHGATGEVVAHTAVAVERRRPTIAYQHDTAVMPAHRGHRLGLLLKSAMVLWLAEAEPAVRTVDTWNAESNDHMVAVNETLGYRWMGRELQFQK